MSKRRANRESKREKKKMEKSKKKTAKNLLSLSLKIDTKQHISTRVRRDISLLSLSLSRDEDDDDRKEERFYSCRCCSDYYCISFHYFS